MTLLHIMPHLQNVYRTKHLYVLMTIKYRMLNKSLCYISMHKKYAQICTSMYHTSLHSVKQLMQSLVMNAIKAVTSIGVDYFFEYSCMQA